MLDYKEIQSPKSAPVFSTFSPVHFGAQEENTETATEIAEKISDKLIEIVKRQFADTHKEIQQAK
jgi:hypothetical protein